MLQYLAEAHAFRTKYQGNIVFELNIYNFFRILRLSTIIVKKVQGLRSLLLNFPKPKAITIIGTTFQWRFRSIAEITTFINLIDVDDGER